MDILNEASKDIFIEIDPRKLHWSAKTYAQKLMKLLHSLPISIFQMIYGGKSTCSKGTQKVRYMRLKDIFRGIFTPIPRQLYPDLQQ